MIARLSPAARKALALVILLIPVLLVALALWWPLQRIEVQQADLVSLEQRIRALEQRVRVREQVLAELRLLERAAAVDQLLLEAPTPALAGARLQRRVSRIIRRAGGTIRSVQALDPEESQSFLVIGARIDFTVEMEGLREVLHAIESDEPILSVERLTLRPENDNGGPADQAVGTILQVSAFTRASEAAGAS